MLGPVPAALGIGTAIAALIGALFLPRVTAFSAAANRCLGKLDKAKEAGVRAMQLLAAGETAKKDTREPFSLLSGLEDALRDTFGRLDGYASVSVALGVFTNALDPADQFGSKASTEATIHGDVQRLVEARRALRQEIIRVAELNSWVFRLHGRHISAGQ